METVRPKGKREKKRSPLEIAREDALLEAQRAQAIDCAELDLYLANVRAWDRPLVLE
jgi:hypothetical protein